MIPPTSIDGTDITGATIDGQDVEEITVDGQTVFTATQPAAPASTVTSRPADSTLTGVSDERGLVFEVKTPLTRIGARLSNNTSGVNTVYLRDVNENLISSKSLSGFSGETFDFFHNFQQNQEYMFTVDNGGSSWTVGFDSGNENYPFTGQEIDIQRFVRVGIQQTTSAGVQVLNDFGKTGF